MMNEYKKANSHSSDYQIMPNQNGALSPMIQWPNSTQAALKLLEQSPELFCYVYKHQKAPQLEPSGSWHRSQMLHRPMLDKNLFVPLLWLLLMELKKHSPWPTPVHLLHMHELVLLKHMLPAKKKKKQQLPSISELIPSSNLLQQLSPIKILVKNMSYRF